MVKHIKDEQGNVYKMKKPFYKKWWFWLLVVIIVLGFVFGGSSDKENGGKKLDSNEKSEKLSNEPAADKYYQIGDTVEVGEVVYTLNSVELTDERNQFDESNPSHVVKIQYTMENNSDSPNGVPVGMDLAVYNSDDTKAESYPNDNTMGSVAAGKKIEVTQHFGLNGIGEIELQFAPLVSFEQKAQFKASI